MNTYSITSECRRCSCTQYTHNVHTNLNLSSSSQDRLWPHHRLDPSITDKQNRTFFHWLAGYDDDAAIIFLLLWQRASQVEREWIERIIQKTIDKTGRTALELALNYGSAALVEIYLERTGVMIATNRSLWIPCIQRGHWFRAIRVGWMQYRAKVRKMKTSGKKVFIFMGRGRLYRVYDFFFLPPSQIWYQTLSG